MPTRTQPPWGPPRSGPRRLRVLAVTRIFPNRMEPLACAFQRQQIACLARRCDVEVVATIPYLAGAAVLGDRTRVARLRAVPRVDEIEGLRVLHPRVPYLPGVQRLQPLAPVNAPLHLAGLLPLVPELRGRFDVVLGTYLYPDACAAAALARVLGVPCVIKTHGTDVNVVASWPSIRPILGAALRAARFSTGVSRPLVDALIRLGAPPDRALLLPNGVDRQVFAPLDRMGERRALGLPEAGRILVYVGRLEKEKGLRELCLAFAALRAAGPLPLHLVLVGEGSLDAELRAVAALLELGSAGGRLILAGPRPLPEVARYLGASDALVLPSHAEGTPNVVLEALAAGRPVVASRVGGIPFVIEHERTGILVPPRDVDALAEGLALALSRDWDEAELVAAAPPSWDESAAELEAILQRAVA